MDKGWRPEGWEYPKDWVQAVKLTYEAGASAIVVPAALEAQKELATEYRSLLEGMRDAAKKFGLLQSASTIESAITALDEWCQEKGLL